MQCCAAEIYFRCSLNFLLNSHLLINLHSCENLIIKLKICSYLDISIQIKEWVFLQRGLMIILNHYLIYNSTWMHKLNEFPLILINSIYSARGNKANNICDFLILGVCSEYPKVNNSIYFLYYIHLYCIN